MGQFITELRAKLIRGSDDGEGAKWELEHPLVYQSDTLGMVVVPAGFITNFVSMRRIPLLYSLFANLAQEPATLHDFLYSQYGTLVNGKKYTRADADECFRGCVYQSIAGDVVYDDPSSWPAIKIRVIAIAKAWAMWTGLRLFGGNHWERK